MKTKEFFLTLAFGLRTFLARWGKLIFTFLLTVFGFYIAFTAFQYLNLRGFQSRAKPDKDTVYVKLVNGNISTYSSFKTDTPATKNETKSNVGFVQSPIQTEAKLYYSFRPIPVAKPITPAARRDATGLALLSMHVFPWWSVLLAALVTLGGICYIFYYSLPYYSIEMNKDVDPQELAALFKKFGSEIEAIGNPRKIKRLSNKIRFQYHYLAYKKLTARNELEQLVHTLLLFENIHMQAGAQTEDPKLITHDLESFTTYLGKNKIPVGNKKLVRIMYALNKDSFY